MTAGISGGFSAAMTAASAPPLQALVLAEADSREVEAGRFHFPAEKRMAISVMLKFQCGGPSCLQ